MKHPIDSKCRMCYKAEEHRKCIAAGCTTLVPSEYINRCSKVAGYIHWTVFKYLGLQYHRLSNTETDIMYYFMINEKRLAY